MHLERGLAERHYGEHSEKPFFGELVEFITRGPLVAMVLEGTERGRGRASGDRRDQPARGGAGLDPRRLRHRGHVQPRARFGLARIGRARDRAVLPRALRRSRAPEFAQLAAIGSSGGPELLVLASRSPQRRAILEQLGIPFEVQCPRTSRSGTAGRSGEVVIENALRKARAVAAHEPSALVLGVDTEVVLDGRCTASPPTAPGGATFLRALSGRTHEVWSGLVLIEDGQERTGVATPT